MSTPWWTAAKGATKFALAWLSGDQAPTMIVTTRQSICRECGDRVRAKIPGASEESDWCGTPLEETGRTCGCLIAGKTAIASESCPQGRWVRVTVSRNSS